MLPFSLLFFAAIVFSHVLTSLSRSANLLALTGAMTWIEKQDDGAVEEVGNVPVTGSVTSQRKSAMALMNEVARFHGITHVYKVCGESGPPHERMFHVELCVGEKEVFRGRGQSIRKAQHAAAESALAGTSFTAPVAKACKNCSRKNGTTPTVELNVLAMKRGLVVRYDVEDPQTIMPVPHFDVALMYDYRSNPHQRHHFKKTPYTAVLTVGAQVFDGSGMTPQGARHSAAERALRVLRDSDPPADHLGEDKSPISVVHDMAAKMNRSVQYDVVCQSGPTHMPNFVMRCSVSELTSDGQGNSKKAAKREAAAQMIRKLAALPPFAEQGASKACSDSDVASGEQVNSDCCEGHPCSGDFVSVTLQPVRELISPSTSISEDDKDNPVHPVNQLSRLARAQRKGEPGYLVIYERCIDKKRKEFVVECSVRDPGSVMLTAVGIDPLRKVAKKKAADAMIQLILTGKSSPEIVLPPKPPHPPILKDSQNKEASGPSRKGRERKVSFSDKSSGSNKRAIVDRAEVVKLKSKSSRNIASGVLLLGKKNGVEVSNHEQGQSAC